MFSRMYIIKRSVYKSNEEHLFFFLKGKHNVGITHGPIFLNVIYKLMSICKKKIHFLKSLCEMGPVISDYDMYKMINIQR